MKRVLFIAIVAVGSLGSGAFAQDSKPARQFKTESFAQQWAEQQAVEQQKAEEAYQEAERSRSEMFGAILASLVVGTFATLGFMIFLAQQKVNEAAAASQKRKKDAPPPGRIFAIGAQPLGTPPPAAPTITTTPTSTPTTLNLPPLRDDPEPNEIKEYGDALNARTGATRFPAPKIRLTNHGNVLVEGGTILKDGHGVWVIEFPSGTPRSLENRRAAAEEYHLSQQQPQAPAMTP